MSRPRFGVFDYDPATARPNAQYLADPIMGY